MRRKPTPVQPPRWHFACVGALLCASLLLGCIPKAAVAQSSFDTIVQHDLDFAARQLGASLSSISSASSYPSTTKTSGAWNTTGASSWTSGFFPGALWRMYERSADASWRTAAAQRQAGIAGQKTNAGDHDIGFKVFTSFGNGYRLTGDDAYRQVVLTAAGTLATRYSPTVGCIRSWGSISDAKDFEVIIDNMINLELLFWASKHGGKSEWYQMALSHALKTRENHVRPDGSTYHVVDYNPATGAVKSKRSAQGYNTESTWARGQAWAIYGFTMAYRETSDPRFLDTARATADYFIGHLPSDKVPYWDFELPSLAGQPRDSSAAAIAASGLLELSQLETDAARKQTYLDSARAILTSLSSPGYLAEGTSYRSILLHGTRNNNSSSADGHDTGLIYGDYYFVEALLRTGAHPTITGSITGRVTDRTTSQPIAGATVAASGASATTAADGSYTLAGIAAGSQSLTAAAAGYDPAQQAVTVPENASVTADFALSPVSGAPIKALTFEGGSLVGPSGAESVSGLGATLDTTTPLKGAASARLQGNTYLQQGFAAADNLYLSLYLKLNAAPTAAVRIVRVANGGTTVGNLVLNTDRTLQLRNGGSSIGSHSAALALGASYRVGLHQKKGTGANAVLEVFLAQGDAPFPATPFATIVNGTWASSASQIQLGATNGKAIDATFDDIRLDAAAMP